jgi:hypothetical protein
MILKKILSFQTFVLLLCLIVSSFMFTSFVYAETSGDYVYTINGDNTATITDYIGLATDITIPSSLDGHNVTIIENGSFNDTGVTRLVVPGTVKTLDGSFSGVSTLTDIVLSEGIETIMSSFSGTNISSIVIPDSVRTITNGAFAGVSSLTSIDLGEGVETINNGAFSGAGLTFIVIPDSVTTLGSGIFSSPLQSVSIGSGVTTIEQGVFSGISTLTSVTLSEGLLEIGDYAFTETSLTSVVIPNGVISIGSGAFSNNMELKNINIPDSVTTIKAGAFMNTGLESLVIPDSITFVGGGAFSNLSSLVSLEIGGGLVTVSGNSFYGYPILTNLILHEGISIITDNFGSEDSLATVNIPNSVTYIGDASFSSESIISVNFGNGIRTLNNGPFYYTSIVSLIIPESVNFLGGGSFFGSSLISEVYFLGNAPSGMNEGIFSDINPSSLTIYYYEGKTGFDGSWNIYNTVMLPKPTIITTPASNITSNSSTLNANITSSDNEMNRTTVIGFEYGLTIEYGNNIEEEGESYPTGIFSQNLTSLTCNTTYHYRAYATNSAGTSYGEDITFTTSACDIDDDNNTRKNSRAIGSINPSTLLGKKSEDIVNTNPEIKNPITTPSFSMIYTRLLKQGTRGDDIKQIQTYLTSKGYILGLPDGIFGPKTKQAVINFQKANGLTPDGLIGKLTIAKMNELK